MLITMKTNIFVSLLLELDKIQYMIHWKKNERIISGKEKMLQARVPVMKKQWAKRGWLQNDTSKQYKNPHVVDKPIEKDKGIAGLSRHKCVWSHQPCIQQTWISSGETKSPYYFLVNTVPPLPFKRVKRNTIRLIKIVFSTFLFHLHVHWIWIIDTIFFAHHIINRNWSNLFWS